ncbi:hypothetical protein [Petrotoga sp. 9PWA.NaAc.5.4]|uniref:hypothetical protein n=1 Tax=Petrotoga sp. 9PWA.NaAc.5.4 TaxID=1434328 RepID=UPI000CBB6EE0|nr:hypothetical protein [Petrotoga sp. 9PWA.NaAc.5.4]PNR96262.1 hypothetical protein X924_03035 [Petrotoga sp. 9PWA.NaAc.5.4]
MSLKMVIKLSTYGQFGKPFMNYLESISLNDKTKEYIEILKLYWDNKYDEVLEAIERNISKLRKGSLYYENNPVNKGFILMANARRKKNEGNYIEAAKLNIQAFKTLKDVPHPSGMVGALNNISWWLKDVDKNISLNFTLP